MDVPKHDPRGDLAPGGERVVKANAKRTVLLHRSAGGTATFVKRFHAPGLSGLRDRWRAYTEAEALVAGRSCGLPVPALLGVDLEDGHWTLRTEWIEDATPLDTVLRQRGPTYRRVPLARRLGALVATSERVGIRYPDPHPGNLLVDAEGEVWLVDLARARFGAADPERFRLMLIRACAAMREITSLRFRELVHHAYIQNRAMVTSAPALDDIEAEARTARRRIVARRVEVWRRESSATSVEVDEEGRRVVRVRAAAEAPEEGWRTERIEADRPTVDGVWATAVRATLHGLPTARPRSVSLAPPWVCEVDVPATVGTAPDPSSAASLRALLADRGLALEGPTLVDGEGRSHVGVGARLVPLEGDEDDE
ncbi:MAG: hypothetical protein AAF957_00375 [Planctomycetota bacterium]